MIEETYVRARAGRHEAREEGVVIEWVTGVGKGTLSDTVVSWVKGELDFAAHRRVEIVWAEDETSVPNIYIIDITSRAGRDGARSGSRTVAAACVVGTILGGCQGQEC